MGKKTISNTFTVNTVEDGVDGATPQQIFYRNSNNQTPSTPATSQSEGAPAGWTLTPQGVSDVYKYEWVSMRIKTNDVWGAYSQPAVFAYHAEDGTSIRIRGGAIEFVQGTWPDVLEPYEDDLTTTNIGDIILFDETEDRTEYARIIKRVQPYMEDDKEWNFTTEIVPVGEGYLITSKDGQASNEGHLYVAKDWSDESNYFYWQDCGRIKGEKGDDAVVYELVPDVNVINANSDGTITTGIISIAAYRIEGSQRSVDILAATYDEYVAQFAIDSGSWQNCTHEMAIHRSWRTYIPAESVQSATTRLRLRLLDENNVVCGVCPDITIVRNGAQGKIGRFFYFGGEFNAADTTQTFIVNDAQAPYFEHSETVTTQSGTKTIKRYHVFNYDTNGTYTMAQMWAIRNNWNNKPWEAMTNDFKYIITQALFAAYAQLGSWIFNSDYMLSEKDGNGNPRGQQAYNGMGDSQLTSGFIPSISFDALNGRASFGGDKVRFQPNGAGWLANKNIQWDANGKSEFSGIIHASLMYSNTIDVDGGAYTIDPENSPANTFMGHGTLTLPSAEDYLGLELKFFEPYSTTRGYQPPITLLPQSNEYIAKTYFDIVPLLEMVTQYTVPMGRFVTLKATNLWYNGHEYYCWMVVSGDDGGYSGTVQIGNKTMTYLNGMLMDVETV